MIVECSTCESKVNASEKGEVVIKDDNYPFPIKYVLLECPVCHGAVLGLTELIQTGEDDFEWGEAVRQWPPQENEIDWDIPEIARTSLVEAKLCFKGKAYSACAVMCGRTIEGVCKHYAPKSKGLAAGLRTLKDRGIIDARLFGWGEALREHRNMGAHANTVRTSREDAKDLLDFSIAICEYVFVLNEKFDRFTARKLAK